MTFLGHLAGGWLAARTVTGKLGSVSPTERRRLLVIGTVAGILPDGDFLWHLFQQRKFDHSSKFRHHTWITHTFPFYWIPASLLYFVGILYKDTRQQNQAVVLAASTTVHLLQDSIGTGDGIMLFYPASKQMYGIALSGRHGKDWQEHYIRSPIYLVELLLILVALATFLNDLFHRRV